MTRAGILFDGVWKKFRRGEHHDSLRDLLPSLAMRAVTRRKREELVTNEFWALSDVSFEIKPGEALGIIGPNGAGKSTILKLLNRILKPTRGTCQVTGRAGALIEVAAGFHPDLTGRENVYLQGAIVGMKQAEIDRAFDEIVDFAGVGEFIDTPVKRFSSGMNARLGFAIAAHLNPDVLIIDEVLSVGDAAFQAKCMTRMQELVASGVPVVSVSHNLGSILSLCTHALLLNRGRVMFSGSAADAVREYRRAGVELRRRTEPSRHGIRLTDVQVLDESGRPADVFDCGASATLRIGYHSERAIERVEFAADIHTSQSQHCFGVSTRLDGHPIDVQAGCGHVDLRLHSLKLVPGSYFISVGIHAPRVGLCDVHGFAYPLTIASDRRELGVVALDHSWCHQRESEEVVVS